MFLTMEEFFFLINSDDCYGMWLIESIANTFVVIESDEIGIVPKIWKTSCITCLNLSFIVDIPARCSRIYRKSELSVRIWKVDLFCKYFINILIQLIRNENRDLLIDQSWYADSNNWHKIADYQLISYNLSWRHPMAISGLCSDSKSNPMGSILSCRPGYKRLTTQWRTPYRSQSHGRHVATSLDHHEKSVPQRTKNK